MREIMKNAPTRLFDFGISYENLRKLINAAIANIRRDAPVRLYELSVRLHSSASRTILDLFLIQDKAFQGSNLLINPSADITGIEGLLRPLLENVASEKLLLDSLVGGRIEVDIREFKGYLFSIQRVANFYNSLADGTLGRKLGFQLYAVSHASAIYKRTNNDTTYISIDAGNESAIFNNDESAQEFGVLISTFLNRIIKTCSSIVEILSSLDQQKYVGKCKTYIPTLRTARTLTDHEGKQVPAQQDVMRYTTAADYNIDSEDITITTGLSLYPAILKKRLAKISVREEFALFERFVSDTFFNGKIVEVVPEYESNNIYVSISKEERPLPHLGDGIQAIIILLYPLFTAEEGAWIFIEEPETHLHPGFQRLFIKTITTNEVLLKKNLTLFLTTHSNHLLDFAIDEAKTVNLFTFRKLQEKTKNQPEYQIQLTKHQDLSLLTELGVQNSSVFLSNCTIWVEGITDRIYLRAYLATYIAHLKATEQSSPSLLEGLHYSFLEYAGANVAHYEFEANASDGIISSEILQRIRALPISNRIMLIADKDSGKDTQHEQRANQQHKGFEYVVLEVREIENLLSPSIIVETLKKLYPRKIFDASLLNSNRYKVNYLGRYLKGKFADLPATFVAKSGTLGSKTKRPFAEKAAESLISWKHLTPEAQGLTKRVFDFIVGHNPRLKDS